MDNNGSQPSEKRELPTLAAGIIIYRAANNDIRTAANHTLPAPASSSR